VRAFVALGSNLNDPAAQVRAGARDLGGLPGTRVLRCSSLYRTAPIGRTDQPDFINAVCELDTGLSAEALLAALLDIEHTHGRVREQPGGPRTLDLDLLLHGTLVCREPGLTLPHPRLHERAFVLYPLQEIAPGLSIPGRGRVEALLPACRGQAIERLAERAG
jgi:2-amino-4-hydroxy-6-hydroxymethyldihydropteridine diphosphokinase